MAHDVIIIGSGIAGMSAAAALAREGLKVLVLEAHRHPGGLMRVYHRQGQTLPTGVHQVGSLGEGEILWRYFKYLGILDKARFARMRDATAFELRLPGLAIPVNSPEQFRDDMFSTFSSQQAVLERFFKDLEETVAGFPLYNFGAEGADFAGTLAGTSLADYLRGIGASERLAAVLAGIGPFHGVPPSECPVPVHFLVMHSFLSSTWRVDEHHRPLVDAFTETLAEAGGILICDAEVSAINVHGGGVSGVRLTDGREFHAGRVLFTGHPRRLADILPAGSMRPAFFKRVAQLDETCGVVGVAAVSDGSAPPPHRGSVMSYDSYDIEAAYRQRPASRGDAPGMVFADFMSDALRPWRLKAITTTQEDEWERWTSTRTGRRGDDYTRTKADVSRRVLDAACGRFGIDAASMRIVDAFSPLTVRDFTHSPTCSAYGIRKSISAGSAAGFAARTRLKGFFLAGQNILLPGVVGTVISAMDAVAGIIGRDRFIASVRKASE